MSRGSSIWKEGQHLLSWTAVCPPGSAVVPNQVASSGLPYSVSAASPRTISASATDGHAEARPWRTVSLWHRYPRRPFRHENTLPGPRQCGVPQAHPTKEVLCYVDERKKQALVSGSGMPLLQLLGRRTITRFSFQHRLRTSQCRLPRGATVFLTQADWRQASPRLNRSGWERRQGRLDVGNTFGASAKERTRCTSQTAESPLSGGRGCNGRARTIWQAHSAHGTCLCHARLRAQGIESEPCVLTGTAARGTLRTFSSVPPFCTPAGPSPVEWGEAFSSARPLSNLYGSGPALRHGPEQGKGAGFSPSSEHLLGFRFSSYCSVRRETTGRPPAEVREGMPVDRGGKGNLKATLLKGGGLHAMEGSSKPLTAVRRASAAGSDTASFDSVSPDIGGPPLEPGLSSLWPPTSNSPALASSMIANSAPAVELSSFPASYPTATRSRSPVASSSGSRRPAEQHRHEGTQSVFSFFCVCAPGLEGLLRRELECLRLPGVPSYSSFPSTFDTGEALAQQVHQEHRAAAVAASCFSIVPGTTLSKGFTVGGGVEVRGTLEALWNICMRSRIIDAVRVCVGDPFVARREGTFFRHLCALPWRDFVPLVADLGEPSVTVRVRRSRLRNTGMLREMVAAALKENKRKVIHDTKRDSLPLHMKGRGVVVAGPAVQITVNNDTCKVCLDAGGEVGKRLWRVSGETVALKETLAAAVVYRTPFLNLLHENRGPHPCLRRLTLFGTDIDPEQIRRATSNLEAFYDRMPRSASCLSAGHAIQLPCKVQFAETSFLERVERSNQEARLGVPSHGVQMEE
ncbi:rna methylase family upf0020 protein [Cystoisospora suis]|uniref:Rna methylase family upf0020 protein n=1 Tax=Cystoisospora suis TaxID=483139 RepID=A0A2C6LCT7_9APIC|nr:rna methylase family upf0020 protein [Cystoisospora suis]